MTTAINRRFNPCQVRLNQTLETRKIYNSSFPNFVFLPPANEVAGRFIFLHVSVILYTWGGRKVADLPSGSRHPPPRIRHPPCTVHDGRYGQQAGGTHPTGMHTSFFFSFSRFNLILHKFIFFTSRGDDFSNIFLPKTHFKQI